MKRLVPVIIALAVVSAVAQTAAPSDHDAVSVGPRLLLEMIEGASFVTGGAGEQDRQQLQAQASAYPVHIVFSVPGGEYAVADQVVVSNASGEVLNVKQAGPMLMMKLEPGTYNVEALFGGVSQKRSVTVGSAVQTVNWTAPAAK